MYVEVCPVGVIGGKHDLLTYSSDEELAVGQAVSIPFGNRTKTGIVWREVSKPAFKTKPIAEAHNDIVPEVLLKLAKWIGDYYAVRLPIVLQTIVPAGIGKKRREKESSDSSSDEVSLPAMTTDQKNAVSQIKSSKKTTHLLHGVTGSGKTRVYQELAKKVLAQKKSVLILVPEIALTPQLAKNFQGLGAPVTVLHSRLTEAKRHLLWRKLANSDEPQIVIGPRSALFSPIPGIGLIVIDECHEPSFTQDSQPKYSALRVARALADSHKNATLVLGSATPSINDYYVAKATITPVVELTKMVKKCVRNVQVIDLKDRDSFTTHSLFSNALVEGMKAALKDGQQIMLFHNRRATARVALCGNCGWSAECKNCLVPMRLHHDSHTLQCHICALTQPVPANCPECGKPELEFRGFGSKRIEQEVRKLFPQASVARFDSDTPEKEQLHNRYEDLVSGDIDIIIGTQGIAKGLDLPLLSVIGVVSADTEMYVPDFSSSERAFQLITQVVGRAGRNGQEAHVFIQTMNPDHWVIQTATEQNYIKFYQNEIEHRQAGHLPPFTFLLQLQIGYKQLATAEKNAQALKEKLKKTYPKVTVRGPSPAFHAYKGGKHYVQLGVSSQKRSTLVEIAQDLPQNWQFTLDPINLL